MTINNTNNRRKLVSPKQIQGVPQKTASSHSQVTVFWGHCVEIVHAVNLQQELVKYICVYQQNLKLIDVIHNRLAYFWFRLPYMLEWMGLDALLS